VVLCGADPHGVLYAVRDFSHYYFYKDDSGVVLRPARVQLAPRLKLRGLSESGCNLFSATNNHEAHAHGDAELLQPGRGLRQAVLRRLAERVEDQLHLDSMVQLSAYDEARSRLTEHAHARGSRSGFFVPYRPSHEKPPASVSKVDPMRELGDCPRDPVVRKWYFDGWPTWSPASRRST